MNILTRREINPDQVGSCLHVYVCTYGIASNQGTQIETFICFAWRVAEKSEKGSQKKKQQKAEGEGKKDEEKQKEKKKEKEEEGAEKEEKEEKEEEEEKTAQGQ